jgi:transposase InsO family protein
MSVKALAAVVAVGEGQGSMLNVSALCRDSGVSRKTFYKWVDRYRNEGVEGLEERSRRPLSSPRQTPVEVEDMIVRCRKELRDGGWDHGATTVHWHLAQAGQVSEVPSVSTIHRILVRRGLVSPEPAKRPRSSWCRFEAPAPNEWWQIDAMDWEIVPGLAKVFNVLDDHSRLAVRSRAVNETTTDEAWVTFSQGAEQWGLPAGVLSDNGLCFSGKLRGLEVSFEAKLRDAGVRPFTGRPYHPQTTGKVERFQQTLKKWLRHQPLANTIDELQTQLDEFVWHYNHDRPHQGIGRRTPISRWQASPASQPNSEPLAHPTPGLRRVDATVGPDGVVSVNRRLAIHLGVEWQGQPAHVILDNQRANVFVNNTLIRHLEINPHTRYHGSGRSRGGPRRPRITS